MSKENRPNLHAVGLSMVIMLLSWIALGIAEIFRMVSKVRKS